MSELIPFQVPGESADQPTVTAARPAVRPRGEVAAARPSAGTRRRSAARARRARRWDPAFHVDLLQF